MKNNDILETLSRTELEQLIETLREDLLNMPAWSVREFYETTLEKARERLGVLTQGKK